MGSRYALWLQYILIFVLLVVGISHYQKVFTISFKYVYMIEFGRCCLSYLKINKSTKGIYKIFEFLKLVLSSSRSLQWYHIQANLIWWDYPIKIVGIQAQQTNNTKPNRTFLYFILFVSPPKPFLELAYQISLPQKAVLLILLNCFYTCVSVYILISEA